MTPERWRRVEEIVTQALDQDTFSRSAFLDETCGGDTALREEVETLLAHEGEAEQVLASAVQGSAALLQDEAAEISGIGPGDRIGVYRIIREIGRGGMGTVYFAEREDEFNKHVAIKLVTRGMDT